MQINPEELNKVIAFQAHQIMTLQLELARRDQQVSQLGQQNADLQRRLDAQQPATNEQAAT